MKAAWLTLGNVVGFQAVWLASVAGAGAGLPWAGPLAAAVFAAAMLAWGGRARDDLRLLAVALPLGIALDSAFAASGWLVYAEAWPWSGVAPAWIASLWVGFALTLNHSMARLRQWTQALDLTGHAVSYHVLEAGDVAQALVRYAASNHVSMMILGAATHGLQMQRFIDTVPIRVARDAPCTVILVKQALPFEQLAQPTAD